MEKEKLSIEETLTQARNEMESLREALKNWEKKHSMLAETNAELQQEIETAKERLQGQLFESAKELEEVRKKSTDEIEGARSTAKRQRRFQEGLLGLCAVIRISHLKKMQRAFSRMHRLKEDQTHFSVISAYKEEIDRVRCVVSIDMSIYRAMYAFLYSRPLPRSIIVTDWCYSEPSRRDKSEIQRGCNIARGVDKLTVLLQESARRRKQTGMARWMLHACTDFELAAAAASANFIHATSAGGAGVESHAAQQISSIKVGSVSITSTPGADDARAATPEIGISPSTSQPIQVEAWLSAMAKRFPLQVQTRVANSIQIIRASNAEKRTQALQRELEASKLRAIQIVEESVSQQSEAVSKLQK